MKKWKYITIFSYIFFEVVCSVAQNVPDKTGSAVAHEDAQAALEIHNNARAEVNVAPLKWSVDLAKYAQEWADYLATKNNCEIAHRGWLGMDEKGYGENIFWGSGKSFTAKEAARAWYEEKKAYKYRTISKGNFFQTGHYTQMVWKSTKQVGIGIAKCKSGATIVVANYTPTGNVLGQKPY